MQIAKHRAIHTRANESLQRFQKIILAVLAEGQAIDRDAALEPSQARNFPANGNIGTRRSTLTEPS